jgi:type VI secretion system protein ImpF
MARERARRTVQQSVLDRLLGTEDALPGDDSYAWAQSVDLLKQAVRRDIEWLLNTRRIAEPAPEQYEELRRSVYHFGIPDLTSLSKDAPETRSRLLRYVEEGIRDFEPRLANVRVSFAERDGEDHRELHFIIEGLLRLDPNPEQVAFDTVLEIASGEIAVKGIANA